MGSENKLNANKKGKFDLSEVDDDFNLHSWNRLLKFTRLHNVSTNRLQEKGNIFESQILLEAISSDLRRLEQRIDSLQKNQALLRKDLVVAGVLKLKI